MSIFDENYKPPKRDPDNPFIPFENGKYANLGREVGSDIGEMMFEAIAGDKWGDAVAGLVMKGNEVSGNPVAAIGGAVGETMGHYVDNLPAAAQNAQILYEKVSDPNWWGISVESWR